MSGKEAMCIIYECTKTENVKNNVTPFFCRELFSASLQPGRFKLSRKEHFLNHAEFASARSLPCVRKNVNATKTIFRRLLDAFAVKLIEGLPQCLNPCSLSEFVAVTSFFLVVSNVSHAKIASSSRSGNVS